MPELAEVEFYRRQWNCGLNEKIVSVQVNHTKRIFRDTDTDSLKQGLAGSVLKESFAHGKQMLFRFGKTGWLGVHLGMSGKLRREPAPFVPQKHDHLILIQKKQSLVFSDPRQFGRIRFHHGNTPPKWWADLPPDVVSPEFDFSRFQNFLARHSNAPVKAVLLLQAGFPGIGNWMADEILWQAKIIPARRVKDLSENNQQNLFKKTREVSLKALQIIGKDFSDPPRSWLFQHRWKKQGICPRCGGMLRRATVGGRTTCWCAHCQK